VSDQGRSKLPLSVLAAAAILLSGAVLLLVQITMPNPRGASPPAEGQAAPRKDRASVEPASTGALPKPGPMEESRAIARTPIEALAKGPGPEESVPAETPAETLSAGQTSADTLTTEDRLAEAAPVESVEPEPVRVETVREPTPATVTPSEPPLRNAPVTDAEAASETKPPEPVRAQSPPSAKPATAETREQPKELQAERQRETAQPVQSQFRAKPMTLGAPKQAASGISAGAYASKVHAAIARHRRKVDGASGSATVTFAIGPAGGIRAARVSRSSGKTQLDQAALATVRSAAPFPPPPQGAKSTYSIQIYFR
jgi:protein TonB